MTFFKQILGDGNRDFDLTRACIPVVLQIDRNYYSRANIIIFKKSILDRLCT